MSANPTKVHQYVCYQLSAPDGKWVLTLWQKKNTHGQLQCIFILSVLEKTLPTNNLALIVQELIFIFHNFL